MPESPWSWDAGVSQSYAKSEQALIAQVEHDLAEHMQDVKPGRYAHSLGVARTAEQMALAYGVDPLQARVAGVLHDWDKVYTTDEQIQRAKDLGVDLGVPYELVQPLLHGITAARELPSRYPMVAPEVWQAIERHTIGAADMTPLDMVVFVADGIEPRRKAVPAIARVRQLVMDHAPLEDVYWTSFSQGVAYVVQTERYLYPGTLDIYNELVLARRR